MCILIYWCIFTALASCCSVNEFNIAADNAFITCLTNVSCEAGCYRGYIFPNGQTNESYICQEGLWTPMVSTCKRNYLGLFSSEPLHNPFNCLWYDMTFLEPTVHWLIKTFAQIIIILLLVWFSKMSIEKLISL